MTGILQLHIFAFALAFLPASGAGGHMGQVKELDGWRDWVLNGRSLPLPVQPIATVLRKKIESALAGRLGLDVSKDRLPFHYQSLVIYAPVWAPLPSNFPGIVGSKSRSTAEPAADGPGTGRYPIFALRRKCITPSPLASRRTGRPETLSAWIRPVYVSLAVSSHRIDQVDRADGAV